MAHFQVAEQRLLLIGVFSQRIAFGLARKLDYIACIIGDGTFVSNLSTKDSSTQRLFLLEDQNKRWLVTKSDPSPTSTLSFSLQSRDLAGLPVVERCLGVKAKLDFIRGRWLLRHLGPSVHSCRRPIDTAI